MRNGILLSLLIAVSMPAMAVYKCESQGRITYTDIPCGTTQTALPPLPYAADADAAAARQQAASERRQLATIEKSQQAERAANDREQQRHKRDKSDIAHKKKCRMLELESKWSAEDAAAGSHTVSDKSQSLKKVARRKAERYETECGAGS
jgi:flagellar biosynthesis GTPase FlhF